LSDFVIGPWSDWKNLSCGLFQSQNHPITQSPNLLHFLMRRVLAAAATELLELQPFRRRLPVLGGRIISLFAIAALQRNNFSGHKTAPSS
jgi:hypothetical protein